MNKKELKMKIIKIEVTDSKVTPNLQLLDVEYEIEGRREWARIKADVLFTEILENEVMLQGTIQKKKGK